MDRNNANLRLDLINDIEQVKDVKKINKDSLTIERIFLNNNKYNKNKGEYISIVFDDISNILEREKIIKVLTDPKCQIII